MDLKHSVIPGAAYYYYYHYCYYDWNFNVFHALS